MLEFSWLLIGSGLVLIQTIFWVLLWIAWRTLKPTAENFSPKNETSVSVIICAHNEIKQLPTLISDLLKQQYSNYEIILVDDRSDDGTQEYISSLKCHKLRYIRIEHTAVGWPPKKWAIQTGISHAKNDWLVFTDADCSVGKNWLNSLLSVSYNKNIEVVLGYSPYIVDASLINKFIQVETFLTATSYLGAAKIGFPYMAVGRNTAYRQIFRGTHAQNQFKTTLSGDDDLIINNFAISRKTIPNIDPLSFVFSQPKKTFHEWFTQKTRHYGASFRYTTVSKAILVAFHSSFFLLLIGLFSGLFPFWLILFRNFVQYFTLKVSRNKLKHIQPIYVIWLLEPVLLVIQFLLVLRSLMKKPVWK